MPETHRPHRENECVTRSPPCACRCIRIGTRQPEVCASNRARKFQEEWSTSSRRMTVELRSMGKVVRINLLLLLSCLVANADPCWVHAPNSGAAPVDQLLVGSNACGPAALMNSFHTGSEKWRRAFSVMGGTNDKERMAWIIREVGMRSSNHVYASPR